MICYFQNEYERSESSALRANHISSNHNNGSSSSATSSGPAIAEADESVFSSQTTTTTTTSTTPTVRGPHASSPATCSTIKPTESFSHLRARHTSVPQTARVPGALSHVSHVAGGNHHPSHHATITASGSNAAGTLYQGGNGTGGGGHCPAHPPLHPVHSTVTASGSQNWVNPGGGCGSGGRHAGGPHHETIRIPGRMLSLRFTKSQIDKAAKDKSAKTFHENFSVTLFLLKPDDQSDNLIDYSLYQSMHPTTVLYQSNQAASGTGSTTTTASATSLGGGGTSRQHSSSSFPHQHSNGGVATSSSGGGAETNNSSSRHYNVPVTASASTADCRPAAARVRPLTGGSSSSATPSLRSTEQSSQDSSSGDEDASESASAMKHNSCNSNKKTDDESINCRKELPEGRRQKQEQDAAAEAVERVSKIEADESCPPAARPKHKQKHLRPRAQEAGVSVQQTQSTWI